jgi:hypothetical protein
MTLYRRSKVAFLTFCLGLAPFLPTHSTAAQSGQEPRYLTFVAHDRNGIYLRQLKREEVTLFLNDEPVPVVYLGSENVETAYAFIIENSPRTAPHAVTNPRWGMINIVDQIRYHMVGGFFRPLVRRGPVMVGQFYKELEVLQDFTTDDWQLEDVVYRMQPNFARVDRENIPVARALARGLDLLSDRREKRKALVLFTTTVDRESYMNRDEYVQMLRGTDVELYVVSFAPRFPTGSGLSFEEKMNRPYFLNLTRETSGKLYLSGEYAYIPTFMDDLKTRLSHGHTIGFYVRPGPELEEHKVRIRVRDDDSIKITHRETLIY